MKINSDRLLKISADILWKKCKKNPKKFLAAIPHFEIFELNSIKNKILNILKLNIRLALKKLAKIILLQLNYFIPNIDLTTQKLLWNIHKIINKIESDTQLWKKTNSDKSLKPLDKIFIMQHILKFHSNTFLISQTKANHVIKILDHKFPNLIWPIQIPQTLPLPPNINFKNITQKNKISYLAELINFLESIQHSLKNNFIIKKKLKFKNNLINSRKFKSLIPHSRHPIINANLKIIYQKLKKSNILKMNYMKTNSKKSFLLFEDHKIIELFNTIAKNILEYFSCCDNFSKIKFAIFHFIKFSLASTLKHKHKLSSIQKVFEIYGKNISVIHPKKKNTNISYLTNHQINIWPKKFKNNHWDITKNFPFKNMDKNFSFSYL